MFAQLFHRHPSSHERLPTLRFPEIPRDICTSTFHHHRHAHFNKFQPTEFSHQQSSAFLSFSDKFSSHSLFSLLSRLRIFAMNSRHTVTIRTLISLQVVLGGNFSHIEVSLSFEKNKPRRRRKKGNFQVRNLSNSNKSDSERWCKDEFHNLQ